MSLSKSYRQNIGTVTTAIALALALAGWVTTANAQDKTMQDKTTKMMLGTKASADTVARADLSITPDGGNLPVGSGTHADGKLIFEKKCVSCHGVNGAGGKGLVEPLIGGIGSLATDAPVKTVASYWPYSTTLFDYMRRSMPLEAPLSLTDDEVYALSAYLLAESGIIEKSAVMDATSLPKVQMPNRAGFMSKWPGHNHK